MIRAGTAAELPHEMRALRLHEWGVPPTLDCVAVPQPGPGQVLLRVDAAGLCHSDLHIMDARPGRLPYMLPFTLGHEVTGTVVAVGDDRNREWIGHPCGVHGIWSCGRCRACSAGRDNYCVEFTGPIGCGTGYDGGLADFILVPSTRLLVELDPAAGPEVAPMTDAELTAYHAVVSQPVELRGAIVVVIGIGGLGHFALQVLAQRDPSVILAVDPRGSAHDLALRLGTHHAVTSTEEVEALVAELSGGCGAALVLNFVGVPDTMGGLPRLLAGGTCLVVVGSTGGHLTGAHTDAGRTRPRHPPPTSFTPSRRSRP